MKFNNLILRLVLLAILASSTANAELPKLINATLNNLPSSPIIKHQINNGPLSCKADSVSIEQTISSQEPIIAKVNNPFPISLQYLNDVVKTSYNTMRNGVIRHVTKKVALSLFDFSTDSFSAKNIASYVSDGTKPYLPFEFANGVKITQVTPKGGTIIYRTEMPITKKHKLAASLALAGRSSATTTICNDMKMVDDLLGRDIVIQYDYYDSNGEFYSSFTING